ncbi:hypothetical protein DL764_009795 [Monosporascus ibericus]|uniref:Rhodopsin domain-containing protein n=1 Tax=Monosporascus ibericus TaxID=155417 RepID=A0A4Q4SW47_9PEZI|nr:hypothetical protein DL764_009795 [Monosporascus ibericus]
MSAYGGLGPMVNAVLSLEVVIATLFVGLRLYTRRCILNTIGWDDYLTVSALVLHILFTAFVQVATRYGLGRLVAEVGDPVTYSEALKWEVFAQMPGIMMSGVGKCGVGAFLLRIIRNKFQIRLIWLLMGSTVVITLFASITVIIQCLPVEKGWNPTVEGECWIDFPVVGKVASSWFVGIDCAFAIFPWFVIWDLNMKRKEKITVACGLSLGIFAGLCGILRTESIIGLNPAEYIHETVPMLVWSATESLVTIMCSSIPVLRPLYVRFKYGSKGDSSNNSRSHNLNQYGNQNYALGSTRGIGQQSGTSRTVVTFNGDNASEEAILRDMNDQNNDTGGIKRTDEISVSYETHGKPN